MALVEGIITAYKRYLHGDIRELYKYMEIITNGPVLSHEIPYFRKALMGKITEHYNDIPSDIKKLCEDKQKLAIKQDKFGLMGREKRRLKKLRKRVARLDNRQWRQIK